MMWRDAIYRLFRLRRLVLLCLACLIAGSALGVWLAGDEGPLAQPLIVVALITLFAALHVAMALRWPNNPAGPMTYSLGAGALLTAVIPLAAIIERNPETFSLAVGLAIVFGPFVWFFGSPLIGVLFVLPLDYIPVRNVKLTKTWQMDMTPDAAFDYFALRPDRETYLAQNGPVGWDGFWEERSTACAPDTATGKLTTKSRTVRIKELESSPLSQSLLVLFPAAVPAEPHAAGHSIVIHFDVKPRGTGAMVTKISSIDRAKLGGVFLNWLSDTPEDVLTAQRDHLAGGAPRAICLLPADSLGATVYRYLYVEGTAVH
jgi:hypothetical protein